jgi:SET domain-containing protein
VYKMEVNRTMLEVRQSQYGRGIFATRDIKKDELLEVSPVIIFPKEEFKYLEKTTLIDYVFWWGKDFDECALALGIGSLFNHSRTPNAIFKRKLKKGTINFYAYTDIKEGEEIQINYNGDPDDKTRLWFEK